MAYKSVGGLGCMFLIMTASALRSPSLGFKAGGERPPF